jgi:hypothetical protein
MVFEKLFGGKKEKKKEKKKAKPIEEDEGPKIRCKIIIEILGAPKEHVEKTLKDYLEMMKKSKDFKIVDEFVSEAEQKEKFFGAFAELEIVFKSTSKIIEFCFDYMPSSIEIIEPDELRFKAREMANMLNDLQARLHKLDMLVKNTRAENALLTKNANAILRNNILLVLKTGDKNLKELSKKIGLTEESAKNFLEELIKQKYIKKKGDKYVLVYKF